MALTVTLERATEDVDCAVKMLMRSPTAVQSPAARSLQYVGREGHSPGCGEVLWALTHLLTLGLDRVLAGMR